MVSVVVTSIGTWPWGRRRQVRSMAKDWLLEFLSPHHTTDHRLVTPARTQDGQAIKPSELELEAVLAAELAVEG